MIDEVLVKQTLTKKLTDGLVGKLFTVQKDVRLSALFAKIVYADIAIFDVDGKPIAVFELKSFPQAWAIRKQMDSSLSRTFDVQGVRYSILTDGEEFWIWTKETEEYVNKEFDEVLE